MQEDSKGDITVSLVFFQKNIHKLLQNVNIDAINLGFMERHLQITISKLIKDLVVLSSQSRQQKEKKIPRTTSSKSGLNLEKTTLPEKNWKKGNSSNMFISLYHSLLIEYPGTKKVR